MSMHCVSCIVITRSFPIKHSHHRWMHGLCWSHLNYFLFVEIIVLTRILIFQHDICLNILKAFSSYTCISFIFSSTQCYFLYMFTDTWLIRWLGVVVLALVNVSALLAVCLVEKWDLLQKGIAIQEAGFGLSYFPTKRAGTL